MKDLKGTKTEKNLWEAFAGESQARNKYTYFASAAKKEGYEQIAAFFLETAENEKEHAKIWFKKLQGIGCTKDNLKAAAAGKMASGRICINGWPMMPRKKDLKISHGFLQEWERSKKSMKSVILSF